MVLLHGVLDVTIQRATNLPSTMRARVTTGLKAFCICCGGGPELMGSVDPYVCLDVGTTRRLRSRIVRNTYDPVWNEHYLINVADEAKEIKLWVKVSRQLSLPWTRGMLQAS